MPSKLKNCANQIRRDERGLTLVEVLGVLVLTVMILGSLIYLLQYSSSSMKQVTEREHTMQTSRDIIHHIVTTVRHGLIPEDLSAQTSSNLDLIGEDGQYATYTFDPESGSLTVQYQLLRDDGTLAEPTSITFAEHIQSIVFETIDTKVEVTLSVSLPNNDVQTTSTIVYSTQS
ncbi:hypothetical protein ACX1C1_17240 [Paenibacillus sp. strain BS8-2]